MHGASFRFPGFKTKYFMTDAANAFWKAYSLHFDVSETIRLFCRWHIWRAWTTKLALITSEPHRTRARAALRVLAK